MEVLHVLLDPQVGIATDAKRLYSGHRCGVKGELELRVLAEICGIPGASKAGLGSLAKGEHNDANPRPVVFTYCSVDAS